MGSWRVMLENPHNGKLYGFANLDKLFAFLADKTGENDDKDQFEIIS